MVHFDVAGALSKLTTKCVGRPLIYKEVTGTTMDDAEYGARNQGYSHGTAYVADTQTNARGSKGHKWDGTTSENLLMSLIIHSDASQTDGSSSYENDLEMIGTLSVAEALEDFGVKGTSIKWLNDLWIRGHKLVGALAEYKGIITVDGKEQHLYILGIGVNVNSDMRRNPVFGTLATSVICETGQPLAREDLYATICYCIEQNLRKSCDQVMDMFRDRETIKAGNQVKVYFTKTAVESMVCRFIGVQPDWSIKLEAPSGGEFTAVCAEVSLRPQPQKYVCLYNGWNSAAWSYSALMRTFQALLDTTRYDVKCLAESNIAQGIPSDCSLLVIGQLVAPPSDSSLANAVSEYVNMGGACLCIGTACQLFSKECIARQSDNGSYIEESIVISSRPVDANMSTVNILSVCQYISTTCSSIPVTNSRILTQHASTNPDVCQNDAMVTSSISTQLPSDDRASNVLVTQCDNGSGQMGEQGIADVTLHDRGMADVTLHGRGFADVTLHDYGRGTLGLCALNIEVTYADLENMSSAMAEEWCKRALKDTVHQRDALVLGLLREFGL